MRSYIKFISALLILFVTVGTLKAEETIVRGTINNPYYNTVAIKVTSNKPDSEQSIVTTYLDAENNFYAPIEIHEYVEAYLYNGRDFICKFYLQPGEDLSISLDINDVHKSLKYDGIYSAKNNFWRSFHQVYPKYISKVYYYHPFSFYTSEDVVEHYQQFGTTEDFLRKVENDYYLQKEFLDNYSANDAVHPDNYKRILDDFEARWLNNRIVYYYLQQSLMKPDDADISPHLVEFINSYDKQDLTQLESKEFVNAMMTYLGYLNIVNQKSGPKTTPDDHAQLIKNNFIGSTKYYLMTRLFLKDLSSKNITFWEQNKGQFMDDNFVQEWNLMIDGAYREIMTTFAGISNSGFQLPDASGAMVNLSDYKGQVVYLSFWASWCKPCLTNFSKYANKKLELEEEGVAFINISIDKNREKSIAASYKYDVKGINLYADQQINKLSEQFNISGLPAYFVIDKNGEVTPYTGDLASVEKEIRLLVKQ